jgi:isocitrate/isopropylmalate dehydrogenase
MPGGIMANRYDVVLLPGDGIGREIAVQARRVLERVESRLGVTLAIDEIPCGGQYFLEHGRDWPEGTEDRCQSADVVLLGAVGWPSPDGNGPVMMPNGHMAGYSAVLGNRSRLDLYANIRPVKLFEGVRHRISGRHQQVWQPADVDMVFVRENTEGLYSGMGGTLRPGGRATVATDVRVITRAASERVIRMAFELSKRRNGAPKDKRRRVTVLVKNNVLDGCRLFEQVFHEIGRDYPEIEKDVAIVDAFTQWLLGQPEYYDVVVATNMFGDIVTDLASVLQGGMGLAVGCNVGDRHAMFEPIHGSAPKHAGLDKANPMAMILATGEALRWLGRRKADSALVGAGDAIEAAVRAVLVAGAPLTYDLVGVERAAKMSETTSAILSEVDARV